MDYSNGKIYKIFSPIGDKYYIGSTIRKLYKRMEQNRKYYRECRKKNGTINILFDTYG